MTDGTAVPKETRRPTRVWLLAFLLLEGGYLAMGNRLAGDLAAALLLADVAGRPGRGVLLALFLALFQASFPPLAWPTYVICFVPLFGLWRQLDAGPRSWWAEALAVGFLATWLAAPFLGAGVGRNGAILQAVGGLLVGLQFVPLAGIVRLTRRTDPLLAAGLVMLTAAGAEFLRVFLFDCPILILALPAASTPLAQFARPLTMFGVSGFLFLINFLLLPDWTRVGWRRWAAPLLALLLLAAGWSIGASWRRTARTTALPFTALLVQPHAPADVATNGTGTAVEPLLRTLTASALEQQGLPDLIVWPETVIKGSAPEGSFPTSLLFGAIVSEAQYTVYNSGCLLRPDGTSSRHDKLQLIPFAETIPAWLRTSRVGHWLLDFFRVRAPFSPGERYQPLVLRTQTGEPRRLAVSLCFEMHFPWLPQYRTYPAVDAIVHLTDESWFRGYPGHPLPGTWACQYRAIETRTWGLVCAAWAHTALIDPTGQIVALLNDEACVLDTTPWSLRSESLAARLEKERFP